MPTAADEVAGTSKAPGGPGAAKPWLSRPGVYIALGTALALALRLVQLFRPGYLSGYTQYDDGVYFGNAVRLVNGAIAYRDFPMVQPPGSMLLMTPVALLAKAFGTAWGLGAARLLTAAADAANAALCGLLVRRRGALAAGVATAGYAVYPAALNASQTLLLEPWLNLFCLLGAVLVFRPAARGRGLFWAGACYGFGAAVKIWAIVPAGLAALTAARGWRGKAWFTAGFLAGFGVPCLPFLALAPSGFGRTVFASELVQATHGRFGPKPRLADITGLTGLSSMAGAVGGAAFTVAAVMGALIVLAWVAGPARRGGRLDRLDWYVLLGVVVVTLMMFAPSEWYEHYAAFDGPFLVLAVALASARLAAAAWASVIGAGVAVLVVAGMTSAAIVTALGQGPARSYPGAGVIIPPGACVVTDTVSATLTINRFTASAPGCPPLVDSVGTLIATTDGQDLTAGPGLLAADTSVWQAAFERAQYVWLIGNGGYTGARIAWTWPLDRYLVSHFRLIAFPGGFPGQGDVPRGGLYIRTLRSEGNSAGRRIV
jgi:alpha-1,2-mannosyltransferase